MFLPFNAGTRVCLGQQSAYNEVSATIVRIAHAFMLDMVEPGS